MEFSIKALSPETAKTGCAVLGVYKDRTLPPAAKRVDQAAKGALKEALHDLPEKAGSTLVLRNLPGVAAERVLLVALGERDQLGEAAFRDALRAAAGALRDLGARDAALFLVDAKIGARPLSWNVRHAVGAVREAFYRFDQLKSQNKNAAPALAEIVFPLSPNAQLKDRSEEHTSELQSLV